MQHNKIFNLIKDKNALDFLNEIPDYINDKYKIVTFEKLETVTFKGDSIKKIYISLEGKMQVKNEFENGFIYSFAEVESISYIGAMEIMANEYEYSATLQTTTTCTMIEIEVDDFINWINKDHELALRVLRFVSKDMYKQSLKKGEGFAYPAIYSLISYFTSVYENEGESTVNLKKSREEIGSKLGFSIRTINRNIKLLKEENLISVNRKTISINEEQFNKLIYKLESIK